MKILVNRISSAVSGAEIYNLYLLEELRRYKDMEILFLSNNKELNRRLKSRGINTEYINPRIEEIGTKRQFIRALFMFPFYLFIYYKKLSSIRFDLIIFESTTEKIFLTIPLNLIGANVIWIEHGPVFSSEMASIIKKLYLISSRFVKKIIAVSGNTKEDLIKNGVDRNKAEVIYIGVDLTKVKRLNAVQKSKLRNKFKISQSGKVIGFMGNVSFIKGIDTFIQVASYMASRVDSLFFIVIGDGDQLMWAKNKVREFGMEEKFHFTGFIENTSNFLNALDVLFFPSKHKEGLSLSLLEAQAVGLPILSSDKGGNKEIVSDKTGIIYKSLDSEQIFRKLNLLLKYRKDYGKKAMENVVSNFNIKKNAEQFRGVFLKYEKK